jgi:hypothetical protein
MALAIRCQELLRTGVVKDYSTLARLGIVRPSRMTQIMGLLNLAPAIQEQLLFLPETETGRELISERAIRRLPGISSWHDQLEAWNAFRVRSFPGAT